MRRSWKQSRHCTFVSYFGTRRLQLSVAGLRVSTTLARWLFLKNGFRAALMLGVQGVACQLVWVKLSGCWPMRTLRPGIRISARAARSLPTSTSGGCNASARRTSRHLKDWRGWIRRLPSMFLNPAAGRSSTEQEFSLQQNRNES